MILSGSVGIVSVLWLDSEEHFMGLTETLSKGPTEAYSFDNTSNIASYQGLTKAFSATVTLYRVFNENFPEQLDIFDPWMLCCSAKTN